jgi:DnaJ-class molecular chaperone
MYKLNDYFNNTETVDYYKLLNVPYNATEEQISEAYKSLAKDCAFLINTVPRKKKSIEREFSKFQIAFKILTNKQEKEKYDLKLQQEKEKLYDPTFMSKVSSGTGVSSPFRTEPIVFTFTKVTIPDIDYGNFYQNKKAI